MTGNDYRATDPGLTHTVADPALAPVADGGVWVAWSIDDTNGPEGGICARALGPDGAPRTGTIRVARGARGGFAMGSLVALADGGVAASWRGDEGMGWVARLDATGRLHHVSYLEACDGTAPVLAAADTSSPSGAELVAAYTRDGGRGAIAQLLTRPGASRTLYEGPTDSHSPALAASAAGYALAYQLAGAVEVVDARGRYTIARPNDRVVAHVPSIASLGEAGGWVCAWIGEDTGRLAMYAGRVGEDPVRIADVWAPLERPGSSAPAICVDGASVAVAWREERGPRPAVYLRPLDASGQPAGAEVRVSTRGAAACPGRVALLARPEGTWTERAWVCGYAERRDGESDGVFVRVLSG